MGNKQSLRRADLITSVILFIVALVGCIMSVKLLLRTIEVGKHWFESAGLLPMIVTIFLGICSVSLFLRARKDGARFDFLTVGKAAELVKMKEFKLGCLIVLFLALYIITMMLPGRQYEIATFLYLFISMVAFQERTKKSIINSFIVALISTAVLTYGFGRLAYVPLP